MGKRIICCLLAALLLAGCSQEAPTPVATTAAEPPVTTAQASQPSETQPEAESLTQGSIAETPGMAAFYLGDNAFFCGQEVAGLLEGDVHIHGDVDALVQPGGYSGEIRLRYPDETGAYTQTLYFVAGNPTDAPLAVRDCVIYCLAVNCEAGHRFSLGEGDFVTGETTAQEILAAWGQPASETLSQEEGKPDGENYYDMVYYRPFSYLQIICRGGVAEQVRAYHNAYLHPELSGQEPVGQPGESDAMLLLSQHMDISPYLNGGKGGKTALEMTITIEGKEIQMGMLTHELPQPWRGLYQNKPCIMKSRRCIYAQLPGQEGFIFGNPEGALMEKFMNAQIKGIHAFNPAYENRGFQQSSYRGFTYSGFDHTATIEAVIAALGQPYELIPECGPGWCFVWLHFESENGDTLRLKVDPESNQIIELRLEENSRFYFYP